MVGLITAVVLSAIWCAIAIGLGPAVGFVDKPDSDLKVHRRPAVPLGGVGIFLAVHAALTVDDQLDPGLLAASGILLVTGLIDDRRGLSPWLRLVAAAGAGVVMMAWSAVGFGDDLPLLATGVLLVVVAVNAVNLFDGLDGLAGSAAAVSAVGLAVLAAMRGVPTLFGLVLVGALAGFLVFNWHPARVFLGDNGAYSAGLFLAYGVLDISRQDPIQGLVIPIATLGVFLVDLAVTILRRLRKGLPLFGGDRDHLYDRLHRQGWSVPAVVVAVVAVQAGFIALALMLEAAGMRWWSSAVTLAVAVTIVAMGSGRLLQRVSAR